MDYLSSIIAGEQVATQTGTAATNQRLATMPNTSSDWSTALPAGTQVDTPGGLYRAPTNFVQRQSRPFAFVYFIFIFVVNPAETDAGRSDGQNCARCRSLRLSASCSGRPKTWSSMGKLSSLILFVIMPATLSAISKVK